MKYDLKFLFNHKKILVLDTNILIYTIDSKPFEEIVKVYNYFLLSFNIILIPEKVNLEFLQGKRNNIKKREKILQRLKKHFEERIITCPIKSTLNELNFFTDIEIGESDAIMQIIKIRNSDFFVKKISFISRDKKAVKTCLKKDIDIYDYSTLKEKMELLGILLP